MPSIVGDATLKTAFAILEPYASVALAVSGGPDSMALMHLARRWCSLTGRKHAAIAVLTVDHGLRAEAKDEAAFVAQEAARLGFVHATLTWAGEKPKTGIQAAARRARYDLMTAHCRAHGIACLATAHTSDDQAETLLMRLRRGSGLDGLAAMAAASERGGFPILRPLLPFSKARLVAYLKDRAIPFVTDPSNSNAAFERVRLRHAMKALAAAGIGRQALTLTAARLNRSRDALSHAARDFLESNFRVTPLGQGETGLEAFKALPLDIALRALAQMLALTGGKGEPPRLAKLERLLADLLAGRRETPAGGCLAIATADRLQIYREPGRLNAKPLAATPGSTCVWDGRFVLTLAPGLLPGASVAALGERGWAACRKALKAQGLSLKANRLAALTTPALWMGQELLAAPALNYDASEPPGAAASSPATLKLLPPLDHFVKRS